MMDWTRILPDAPGLRPTLSTALAPTRPTPMAAARQPNAPWMLPVTPVAWACAMISVMWWMFCWLDDRRAHARHAPGGKVLMRGFLVIVAVARFVMVVAVIADQADINAHQQREHERLHKTDEQLEEVERD